MPIRAANETMNKMKPIAPPSSPSKPSIGSPFLWLTDPNPAGLLVYISILAALVAAVLVVSSPAPAETPAEASAGQGGFQASTEADAMAMIRYWIRLAPRHPMANHARQARFARLQVAATEKHGTPLSLTMAIMFRESSCRPGAKGTRGEIGLMQVHPWTWATYCRGLDPKDPGDQVQCGHTVLREGFDRCGSWRGALTWYASKYDICKAKPRSNLAGVVRDRFKLAAELETVARR